MILLIVIFQFDKLRLNFNFVVKIGFNLILHVMFVDIELCHLCFDFTLY
jgi:hypothetical protein